MCDNCDCGWHMYCLPVALQAVPEGDWYCPDCTAIPWESESESKPGDSDDDGGGE